MTESVVVTGLGVIAPNGAGVDEYWKATLDGRNGIAPIDEFAAAGYPVHLAGRIADFDPKERLPGRLLPQTDRVTRLALVAADWALADAGVDPARLPEYDMGVVTSNASGGFEFTHTEINKLWRSGPQFVSVYESFAWFYAVNTGQISIRHGMRGPSGVIVTEQAGGLDAVGHARRNLRRGGKLMLTGGVESSFDPWGWVSHIACGHLSGETDPETAYRPFDADADGYLPGEGGAIIVLENADAAARRGAATVYGEIAGYAATFDAKPHGLARSIQLAMADAGLRPEDVDVVFADAAGVPELDRAEAEAIGSVFGPRGVPVTAPKSLVGRLYSGGPPLDIAAACLSIRDGVLPPTAKTATVPDEYGLDVVLGQPRAATVRVALVLARGRGGFNAAVAIRAATDHR